MPLIIFGSDETIQTISEVQQAPIQGFGSQIRIGACMLEELDHLKDTILREAFSIEQRGCRSIRALIIISTVAGKQVDAELTLSKSWQQLHHGISDIHRLNLQHYFISKQLEAGTLDELSTDNLNAYFPIVELTKHPFDLETILAGCPFVLPIITVQASRLHEIDWDKINGVASSPRARALITKTQPKINFESFQEAQARIWDNFIDQKLLFHV